MKENWKSYIYKSASIIIPRQIYFIKVDEVGLNIKEVAINLDIARKYNHIFIICSLC